MNREIKFRGKRLDTGEWVYGYYAVHHISLTDIDHKTNQIIRVGTRTDHAIFNDERKDEGGYWKDVIPETVGQFTGLHDKNGKEIYEGDILHLAGIISDYSYSVVQWNNEIGAWCVRLRYESHVGCKPLGEWMKNYHIEVVGNIHDNQELIN